MALPRPVGSHRSTTSACLLPFLSSAARRWPATSSLTAGSSRRAEAPPCRSEDMERRTRGPLPGEGGSVASLGTSISLYITGRWVISVRGSMRAEEVISCKDVERERRRRSKMKRVAGAPEVERERGNARKDGDAEAGDKGDGWPVGLTVIRVACRPILCSRLSATQLVSMHCKRSDRQHDLWGAREVKR